MLAVADALRGREAGPPQRFTGTVVPQPRPEPSPELVRRLRAEGVEGLLVVADAACRVSVVRLPELTQTAQAEPSCALDRPPERELRLSAEDLRRTGVATPRVVDHAWLSSTRVAVLLAWPGGGYVLGLYEGRRLLATHRWGGDGPGRLDAAPGGGLFAARPARVFRRDGRAVRLAPRFRNARAVAWSPDGRWAALAMVGATVVVPTHGLVGGAEARRAVRLPHPARDLVWRAR